MKKKKWNKHRYGLYYETLMQPVWTQYWNDYLKRIKHLKKDVLSLGPIPQKESQLISTINYFIKVIDLVTNFADKGILTYIPTEKSKSVSEFNDMIVSLVAREDGIAQYLNKAEFGKSVTYDNLYLGMFTPISHEDIKPNMRTKLINGTLRRVEVEFTPLSDWLNNRVISVDGYSCRIKQKDLANIDRELTDMLLEAIDNVLS